MKKVLIVALATIMLSIPFLSACAKSTPPPTVKQYSEINIGALVGTTGGVSFLGQSTAATLKVALPDINDHLTSINSNYRVTLNLRDTGGNPDTALEKLKELSGLGIQYFVGPLSSSEIAATRDYANRNSLMLVSPTSTALSLAAEDNVYRLILNDSYQAKAITRLISEDNISTLIPLYRGDVWGDGLVEAVKTGFEKSGRTVARGFRYSVDTTDFTQAIRTVESQLREAKGNAAVYLVSFNEAIPIFRLAAGSPTLSSFRWYGTDGTAGNNDLINDRPAAEFARKTGFTSPGYGPETLASTSSNAVIARVKQSLGWDPPLNTLSTYDILWMGTRSYLACGKPRVDFADLKKSFLMTAATYYGITGNTALDASGDLTRGAFLFWTIENNQGTLSWKARKMLIMNPGYESWYPVP
jgi:branched-chain amino acid transport system substrate-binding protein